METALGLGARQAGCGPCHVRVGGAQCPEEAATGQRVLVSRGLVGRLIKRVPAAEGERLSVHRWEREPGCEGSEAGQRQTRVPGTR